MPPVRRALLELSTGGAGRDRSFAMQRSRQDHIFRQTTDMTGRRSFGAGALFMSNVWNMGFAGTKPVRLQVAYEQPLSSYQDLVPVTYVLTPGALWVGPIGYATVTMSAPNGGEHLFPASIPDSVHSRLRPLARACARTLRPGCLAHATAQI